MNEASDTMPLTSCLCTQAQLASPRFRRWVERLGEPPVMHRKVWEWCYICEALDERDLVAPGRRGLGFAVGKEPLASCFAAAGCDIVATDLPSGRAAAAGWIETEQHASGLEHLNARGLCPPDVLSQRLSYEAVDMNAVPDHLRGFDFIWSACSIEHLGSISHGEQFVYNALRCLKIGGCAVHTTEFNLSSNTATLDYRGTVVFRRCDIERMADRLLAHGHRVAPLDFTTGDMPLDQIIDVPPYAHDPHLKLKIKQYTCTSIGFIIEKGSERIPQAPRHASPRSVRDMLRPHVRRIGRGLRNPRRH